MASTFDQSRKAEPSLPQYAAIEARSIDYVPDAERHGKIIQQGPFWFLGNFQFFTLAIGFIGPGMGLSFLHTSVASILGILFGTWFMAFHASQGPDLGLPQMIQSRAQFGYRGVVIPLLGTLFTFVGFNVVDTVLICQGLHSLYAWSIPLVATSLAILAAIIAIYGHDWLHTIFRALFWISLPIYCVFTLSVFDGTIAPKPPANVAFTWVAFAAQFAACASYNITYAPYVSDYTRYLPRSRSRKGLVLSVYLGASLSAIWLIVLGAWLATYFGASDGLLSTSMAGNQILPGFGTLTVLVSVGALTATMGLNAYSGMLTVVTAIDSMVKIRTTRSLRIVVIAALMMAWLWFALALRATATTALFDALSIMLYLLAPWTAVNLVDYFFVLFKPDGIYGAWHTKGIIAYTVGVAASVPFFNLAEVYEGWAAKAMGGVDIAWLPGLLVAGLAYVAFTWTADLASEAPAIQASSAALDAGMRG
jgi:purine-cytosine permease-like protein